MPSYNYSQAELLGRMGDTRDKKRAGDLDAIAQRVQAGDESALHQLAQLAGIEDNPNTPAVEGAATADAKNYARMLLGGLNVGYTPEYMEKGDGAGFFDKAAHTVGSVLKIAAPIAGALIPGVGTLGSMAIGAGGSALGGALHGDKFNFLKTLLAGGASAAGNKLLGNGLGSTIPGAPAIPGSIPGMPTGLPAAGAAAAGAAAPGGSLMDKLGGAFKTANGNVDIGKLLGLVAAGMGFMDAQKQGHAAADFNNAQLELKKRQMDMAEKDYASRAPMRDAAFSRLGAMAKSPPQSSVYQARPAGAKPGQYV